MPNDGDIDFGSREDVERFLTGKPPEWAMMLAARAALRVLPLLASAIAPRSKRLGAAAPAAILLPLLRGTALPWLTALIPGRGQRTVAAAADAADAAAAHAAHADAVAADASAAAAYAADAAARAADANVSVYTAADAPRAIVRAAARATARATDAAYAARAAAAARAATAYAAAAADAAATDDARAAIRAAAAGHVARSAAAYAAADDADDAARTTVRAAAAVVDAAAAWMASRRDALTLIAEGPRALAEAPLWPDRSAPPVFEAAWREFSASVARFDGAADWIGVWLDWYKALRDGRAPWGLAREVGERILIEAMLWPQEDWHKGALHINPRIRTLIEVEREELEESADLDEMGAEVLPSVEALPEQESFAYRFNGLASGPIQIAAASDTSDRLLVGPDRQEDYADIRTKGRELSALGPNRLGHLVSSVDRLLALPEAVAETRAQAFWSVLNTLRIKLEGHEAAVAHRTQNNSKPDYEKDDRLLDSLTGDGLQDLVETINAFVLGDPALVDRDAARPGPQEIQIAYRERQLIEPVAGAAALNPAIASGDAGAAVTEELAKIGTGASLAERQGAEAGQRTIRNFIATLLRRAYVPLKKAGVAAASEVAFAWKEARSGFYKKSGEIAGLIGTAAVGVWLTGQWATIAAFVAQHATALSAYAASAFPKNPQLVRIIETIAKVFGSPA
ncbi:hypothetical protein ACWIGM_00145 [Bosea sp. NPDC055332]